MAQPSRPSASTGPPADICAIDFGTSNSAIAVRHEGRMALVPLEDGQPTMPTAVFYLAEGPDLQNFPRRFGRAAVAAYVEGVEGRLMRSMKSALGSSLMTQHTDIGAGRAVGFDEVISGYLFNLRRRAQQHAGHEVTRLVLGRPVFFVDDDAARDAQAQAALDAAARAVGFREVAFQFEPIAAAFHYEQSITREEIVVVADIGGGTSDFSVVRVGPARAKRVQRRDDILANHGIHLAGTDFDRRVELASILRELGFGAYGPPRGDQPAREVPSRIYFDLATWHLINTVYRPQRLAELRAMRGDYAEPRQHERLMTVLNERLGHDLAARAEAAKIAVAAGGSTRIDLDLLEAGLALTLDSTQALAVLRADIERIVATAVDTVRMSGLAPDQVDALYFTGGSTGLAPLADALAAAFPTARPVHGDRFASVATGLGLHAERLYA